MEYAQDWLTLPVGDGQKQAIWRSDPARSGPAGCVGDIGSRATRIPAGHPEEYLEGFATLYADAAEQVSARRDGRAPDPASLPAPTVEDGVAGMRFIEAAVPSSGRGGVWTELPAVRTGRGP